MLKVNSLQYCYSVAFINIIFQGFFKGHILAIINFFLGGGEIEEDYTEWSVLSMELPTIKAKTGSFRISDLTWALD